MAKKPVKIAIDVDDRTNNMSSEALGCRGWNHPWIRTPMTADRRASLRAVGRYETVRVCYNQCGCTWTQEYDISTGAVAYDSRDYPDDYKMPKGEGRLRKNEARKALMAREMDL